MAAVVVAAVSASFAFASWILELLTDAAASVSWRLRSVVSAVARTAPFLTVSPTLTLSVETRHVVEPELEPVAAVAPARWAGAPNETPYDALEATLPVAATSLVTSPVATAPVRYRVVLAALAGRPPTATNAAPTPTTPMTTMARILTLMNVSRDGSPCGATCGRPTPYLAPAV